MGKKCIPGVMCIENMTLFLLVILIIMVFYFIKNATFNSGDGKIIIVQQPHQPQQQPVLSTGLMSIATRRDPINDPYSPPMKRDGLYYPTDFGDIRSAPLPGLPINIKTQGVNSTYQQVGILTRTSSSMMKDEMILPLMGRRLMTSRDKWQYYTMSNTGNINTKLPVSVNGKSCTNEYGCDSINNNDMVYVEGYGDVFRATIYENCMFQYLPF